MPNRCTIPREELDAAIETLLDFVTLAMDYYNQIDGDPDLEDDELEPSGEEDTAYQTWMHYAQ